MPTGRPRYLPLLLLLGFPVLAAVAPLGAEPLPTASGHADWVSGFHAPGMNGDVVALTTFQGERIAAGRFTVAGGIDCAHIARWDGTRWQPLAEGLDGDVLALAVWEGELVAAGRFVSSGNVPLRHIARWDGAAWHPFAEGLDGDVLALTVFRDILVAGGIFRQVGSGNAEGLALWDGRAWSSLGEGVLGGVRSMLVYDGELVVSGPFDAVGSTPARHIAAWNGSRWHALGNGLDGDVQTLCAYAGELVAGGAFTGAAERNARALVSWDGARWHGLGNGPPGSFPLTYALAVHAGDLVAAGSFADPSRGTPNTVVRWDGRAWSPVGRGMENGNVLALCGMENVLDAAGSFTDADGEVVNGICRFEGSRWSSLSTGSGFDAPLRALVVHDGSVVAGGSFTRAGSRHIRSVARWNGWRWEALGAGLEGEVLQMATFRGDLIAAGRFSLDAASPEVNVARWTGSHWEALGAGLNGSVFDLAVYRDELWAVGRFTASGTTAIAHLAAWDGQSWRGLPLVLDVGIGRPQMTALAVYDDALVIGGRFERVNGLGISNLAARRDGVWYGFGDGVDEVVEDLAVHQGKLYVAGFFNYAGGQFAPQVAAWDSVSLQWSPAGTGLRFDDVLVPDAVLRLHSFGADLLLGGRFDGIDVVRARNLARWDGARWWPLGSGANAPVVAFAHQGAALFVGGDFDRAGGMAASFVAEWDRDLPAPVRSLEAEVVEGRVLLRWELEASALERTHLVRLLRGLPGEPAAELPGSPLRAAASMRFIDDTPSAETLYEYHLLLVQRDGTRVEGERLQLDTGSLSRTALAPPRVDAAGDLEVRYSIGRSARAELRLFDVRGRLVATLAEGPHLPGDYFQVWNRRQASGLRSVRGVYFLRLQVGTAVSTRKVVLLDD